MVEQEIHPAPEHRSCRRLFQTCWEADPYKAPNLYASNEGLTPDQNIDLAIRPKGERTNPEGCSFNSSSFDLAVPSLQAWFSSFAPGHKSDGVLSTLDSISFSSRRT